MCTLNIDKLHVCCVQTQRLNHVETDNFSFCGDEIEVIGMAVLNKESYEILVLYCRNIDNSLEKIDNNGAISSIENSVTIEQILSLQINLMTVKKVHLLSI